MRTPSSRLLIVLILTLTVLSGALTACSAGAPASGNPDHGDMKMASLKDMPMQVQQAPVSVQESYQFAVANPDVLKEIPCYCGCGSMGHTSNYACYVKSVDDQGVVSYDDHALGCSICVDITQDTMRMMQQGKTVPEIKTYVDDTYAKFGPSNMP